MNKKNINSVAKTIIEEKTPCVFVSPHLDDAVFSAGDLLMRLSSKTEVTIATVFTEASLPPYTLSAKAFLKNCGGYKNAQDLFSLRRGEDIAACRALGVKYLHLGFQDASFRKKTNLAFFAEYFGKFIPEINHVYPFYRFNIISGKISEDDRRVMAEIEKKICLIAEKKGKCAVFCPLGVGNHADHIIVREVCRKKFKDAVFWEDFPYNYEFKGKASFGSFAGLGALAASEDGNQKHKMISIYKSQIGPMFPDGITLLPEKYYREKRKEIGLV